MAQLGDPLDGFPFGRRLQGFSPFGLAAEADEGIGETGGAQGLRRLGAAGDAGAQIAGHAEAEDGTQQGFLRIRAGHGVSPA